MAPAGQEGPQPCGASRERNARGTLASRGVLLDPPYRRSYRRQAMKTVINDFSIHVATVNGSGSQTANLVLLRSLFQMGIPVSGKNLFPSNIAGLPTWFPIRAAGRRQRLHYPVRARQRVGEPDGQPCPAAFPVPDGDPGLGQESLSVEHRGLADLVPNPGSRSSPTPPLSRARPSTGRGARRPTLSCCVPCSRWGSRSRARISFRRTSRACRPGSQSGQPVVANASIIPCAPVNGSGSQTANLVLLRSLFQMGIPVSGKNLFPSNIAGLPTWFTIRASAAGWVARRARHEILVVMNAETAASDVAAMGPGAVIVVNDAIKLPPLPDDRIVYPVPMTKLMETVTTDVQLRRLVANTLYVRFVK